MKKENMRVGEYEVACEVERARQVDLAEQLTKQLAKNHCQHGCLNSEQTAWRKIKEWLPWSVPQQDCLLLVYRQQVQDEMNERKNM